MDRLIFRLFTRYGSLLSHYRTDKWISYRGFLQPVTGRGSAQYLKEVSPTGEIPLGSFVYFGPATMPVAEGNLLKLDGQIYKLNRVELLCKKDTPIYYWGICTRAGGEDNWGQS